MSETREKSISDVRIGISIPYKRHAGGGETSVGAGRSRHGSGKGFSKGDGGKEGNVKSAEDAS